MLLKEQKQVAENPINTIDKLTFIAYMYIKYLSNHNYIRQNSVFLVAKLLYKSKCSSVRLSVYQPRLGET